jgi:hemolysin activation/secretion protein
VILLRTEKKKNGAALAYDSRQSQLVESGRVGASAYACSTLREGDALRGRLSATPDGEQARSASLQHGTPIGTDGLAASLGAACQEPRPDGVNIKGDASFLSAGTAYPVILDFKRELSVTADLDRTEGTNTALGSVIANERISAVRLGTKYTWSEAKRSASIGVSYARGIELDESRTSVPGASPAFNRTSLSANALQVISPRLRLRLRGTAQWSGRALPANERLAIGGAEFGRGFDNALLSFDRGYAVMIEPAFRPLSSGAFAGSEIYLFADYADGMISPDTLTERTFDLGSAGVGTRIVYKDIASLGLEIAEPWKQPVDGLDDDPVVTVSWGIRYQR